MIRFQQLVESEKKVWLFNKRKWRSGSRLFNKLKWRSGSRLLKLKRKSIVHFLWSRTRKCTLFCCSLPTTLPSPIIRFSSPCQITGFIFYKLLSGWWSDVPQSCHAVRGPGAAGLLHGGHGRVLEQRLRLRHDAHGPEGCRRKTFRLERIHF